MRQALDLRLAHPNFGAFSPADRVFLRDARGRSSHPSIYAVASATGPPAVFARGPFLIRYDYRVTRAQGVRFVEVTGDENRIHRDGDVVAGAMTASKILVPLEILFPTLRLESARVKFTGVSRYDRRTSTTFCCAGPQAGKVVIDVNVYQDGALVATAQIDGSVLPEAAPAPVVRRRSVNAANLRRVQAYFHSVGIDSRAYFEKGAHRDYTYPFGFIMSLPSAAMVRQFNGQGGMINMLTLTLKDQQKIPITRKEGPAVRLQDNGEKRSFHRILADVLDGVATYYRGMALVHPRTAFA